MTGLQHIVNVATHLLNPAASESSAAFVGRLVTCLIQKTGDRLGEHLDHLLKAVLSKLQRAETLTVIQSLVLVYAHLIHTQVRFIFLYVCIIEGRKSPIVCYASIRSIEPRSYAPCIRTWTYLPNKIKCFMRRILINDYVVSSLLHSYLLLSYLL